MKNNKYKYPLFMKAFYRISKERLEAYFDKLNEASDILREIRPDDNKGNADWEKVDKAWGKVIDVINSLHGFKNYEDAEAGGEVIQDLWINWSGFDEHKFFEIEFPNGVENQPIQIADKK